MFGLLLLYLFQHQSLRLTGKELVSLREIQLLQRPCAGDPIHKPN